MNLGEGMGCHQKPERSFFIKGYQMPVCARCSGVFIGYTAALCCAVAGRLKKMNWIAPLGCLVMLTDWSVQALKIKESTNMRRLFTGIFGGFGIMAVWISVLSCLLKKAVRI